MLNHNNDMEMFAGLLATGVNSPQKLMLLNYDNTPLMYEYTKPAPDHPVADGESYQQLERETVREQAWIELYSMDADVIKKHQDSVRDRKLELSSRGKMFTTNSKISNAEVVDLMVAATTSWNLRKSNGEPIPFSKEYARRLYSFNEASFITEQILMFINERTNFVKP